MRTNERKGAWTLLIGVLLFGALVWGLGGRQMREDSAREATAESAEVTTISSDSTADNANGKRRHARRSRASKKSSKRSASGSASNKSASAPTRDILADTISLEK